MREFKNKNDYSIMIFNSDEFVLKWTYVHSLLSVVKYLQDKNIRWSHINVYARRSGRFIRRQYPDQVIINKPK